MAAKKRVVFLVPENRRCGVHDYSMSLLGGLRKQKGGKNISIDLILYKNTSSASYYLGLAKELSLRYDLIHLQHEFALFGKFGIGFFWFLLGVKKPLVVTFHEFHKGIVGLKEKMLLIPKAKISRALVLSDAAERLAEGYFPKKMVVNTGFGASPRSGVARAEKGLIVHPGFIRNNKNQLFTIKLARLMPEKNFVLAGGGSGPYFEEVSRDAKGAPNVRITGFLSKKDYVKWIGKAESTILPYTDVVQSAAFFDAIAAKKKVLASNCEGFRQFEREGIVECSSLDAEEFAKKLSGFSRAGSSLLMKNINHFMKNGSFDAVAARNIEVYEGALGGK